MAKKAEPILIRYNDQAAEYEVNETQKMAGHLDDCYQTAKKLEKDLNEKSLFDNDLPYFISFVESPEIETHVKEVYLEGEEVTAGNVALDKSALMDIIALPESFTRLQQLIAVWEDFKTRRPKIVENYMDGLEIKDNKISVNQDYPERIKSRHRVFLGGRAAQALKELEKIAGQLNGWQEKYRYNLIFPGGDTYPLASTTLFAQRQKAGGPYHAVINKVELIKIKDNA